MSFDAKELIKKAKDDKTESVSVSLRKSTLKRIKDFMKRHNLDKFSPVLDGIANDFLDEVEEEVY